MSFFSTAKSFMFMTHIEILLLLYCVGWLRVIQLIFLYFAFYIYENMHIILPKGKKYCTSNSDSYQLSACFCVNITHIEGKWINLLLFPFKMENKRRKCCSIATRCKMFTLLFISFLLYSFHVFYCL